MDLWISIKFGTDIHETQRINPYNFGDLFHLVPPVRESFHLSNEISQYISHDTWWIVTKFVLKYSLTERLA